MCAIRIIAKTATADTAATTAKTTVIIRHSRPGSVPRTTSRATTA
ncbi:hypothetical protein [Gordonia neofelifaecis]|uniref:Uncharacterized protein n=1 Tax=Gordonia neofelifaecis NRRL B-59395 TaxID=644548 RepID=F1YPW4_9ACTN|nr:hypothetical protein [Gordonia neofelifaecis]EGD53253.1 hypothetical protein SCNU_19877 [Gordonia neofelifaecis NRRL B-59395]